MKRQPSAEYQQTVTRTLNKCCLSHFPEGNPCPIDVTGNGNVNIDDLLAVINGWGSCAQYAICEADTNYDCVVNIDDLLAVINAWGTNGCPSLMGGGSPSQAILDCIDNFEGDIDALYECIQAAMEEEG